MRIKTTAVLGLAMLCLFAAFLVAGCCSNEDELESECLTVEPNTQSIVIRDYAYDRFRFFDLGLMGDTCVLAPGDSLMEFRLFQSVSSSQNDNPFARAHANWLDREGSYPIEGRFRHVSFAEPGEYSIHRTAHYLWFSRRLSQIDNTALAYFMVYRKANGDIDTVGSYGARSGDTLDLQVLKVHSPSPTAPLWEAEWRNVYDLRIRDIDYDNFDLHIFKGLLGDEDDPANLDHQNSTPYLRIFELDVTDATGTGGPDNKIDDNAMFLDLQEGLLVFPNRRPFADTESLAETVPEIYTSNNTETLREVSKYYIKITTRQRSRIVRLGMINILEGSEVITFNGDRLTRGSDYDIDYCLGTVTFKRDDVLDPDVSLVICYMYAACCP